MSVSISLPSSDQLPRNYREVFSTRARIEGVVAFALIAAQITACVVLAGNFGHVFTAIHPIGVGVTMLLIGGTSWVIYRACKKKDPLVESQIFRSRHFNEHIEEAVLERTDDPEHVWKAYIDKSTLDDENGKAYLYAVKDCRSHYYVSTVVSISSPAYIVGTLAYHALRICVVPFYVLVSIAVEATRGKALFANQRRFELIDVMKEPGKSLLHLVKAPFYGLAFLSAALYSLVNPMGGRVLAAKIERDWNGGASRAEGCWSVNGRQPLWAGWDELGPKKLGQFKFFLAGCWQPIGIMEYKNGIPIKGESLSHVLDQTKGYTYNVFP